MNKKTISTRTLVGVAIFTAIVFVLQLLGSYLARIGIFSLSVVLIPIVVGAALYGPLWGAWFGLVFGLAVLASGDAALFLAVSPLGAVATVLIKGMLAGLSAGLVYKLLSKTDANIVLLIKGEERWGAEVSVIAAAFISPIVNTGIFLLGCKLFFMSLITEWATAAGAKSVGNFMIFGLAGANFLIELVLNIIMSPVIVRLIKLGRNRPQYTT